MDAPRRRDSRVGYDVAFGVPDCAPVKNDEESRTVPAYADDSRTDLRVDRPFVAVAVQSQALLAQVHATLAERQLAVGGPDLVPRAALVIAEASGDATVDLSDLRRRARPDAAILLVLTTVSSEAVASAHQGGAFACLRPPLVREELIGLVTSALDARAARVQAADLARKLDLESHLASIGRISAGLSHEVNTPLGAATLNMETVERECGRLVQTLKWLVHSPPHELAKRLEIAREQIATVESPDGLAGAIEDTISAHKRLQALFATIQGLVGRSRGVRRETIDLLALLQDVRKWLVEDLRGTEVEVVGDPLSAIADRTLLGQILQNLVSNAAHAARSLPSPRIRLHVYAHGPRVVVSVRDNGPGIPLELQDRIFEPFFTTRRGRGGTGLGLALCREYARQLQADLSVSSLPGRGACFRVTLQAS